MTRSTRTSPTCQLVIRAPSQVERRRPNRLATFTSKADTAPQTTVPRTLDVLRFRTVLLVRRSLDFDPELLDERWKRQRYRARAIVVPSLKRERVDRHRDDD